MVIGEEITITKISPQTYQQWLAFAEDSLQDMTKQDPYANPKVDANRLLQFVTQKSKGTIIAFSDTLLTENESALLSQYLVRRCEGEPIAYILGEQDFWSLNLEVSPDTLIPRPDTEILVEKALEFAKFRLNSPHFSGELAILDLGTGTGAIALALAAELAPISQKCGAKLRILGVDLTNGAVELAKRNALRNQLPQVEFLQSNWFEQLENRQFDIIVGNPPYIDRQDEHLALGDVRFEPLTALVAEDSGYADLRHIIERAPFHLKHQGWLILEHGWQQGQKVRSIFNEFSQNYWQQVATMKDYGDNERITLGCWNKE
ncbi:peptide chain release factor N(5)-glutamine methyltransferase [[Mannheimia] succiniciproducens]|nr:peptide chain release factor N(5)-glutamine methyltransferase [[Mannheimia] succiniciproducens]